MGGEQDDVGGDRGRVQVLLVLSSSPLSAHEQTTRVGARSSFAAASGPAACFSALERLGAEDAEAPGIGQVVVGRPAGELEQLVERLAVDRLGPVGLVGAPGADRLLDVHRAPTLARRLGAERARSGGRRAASEPPATTGASAPTPASRRRSPSVAGASPAVASARRAPPLGDPLPRRPRPAGRCRRPPASRGAAGAPAAPLPSAVAAAAEPPLAAAGRRSSSAPPRRRPSVAGSRRGRRRRHGARLERRSPRRRSASARGRPARAGTARALDREQRLGGDPDRRLVAGAE